MKWRSSADTEGRVASVVDVVIISLVRSNEEVRLWSRSLAGSLLTANSWDDRADSDPALGLHRDHPALVGRSRIPARASAPERLDDSAPAAPRPRGGLGNCRQG